LKFALKKYPALLAKTGAISPTTDVETTIPDNATSLYKRSIDDTNKVGKKIAMPWDTQLDATSNTRLQQELTLLVQGNVSAKEFISTMDSTIAENGPKAFR
jgi:raffinose/stachyose/melibiose transport system substrate-binding protein